MLQYKIDHETLTYGRKVEGPRPEDLVHAHSQLVRRVAWQVHSRMSTAIEVEDLIQIGMVALIEAARTFEDRGIAFGSYAAIRVRGAMIDELRRDARMARAGMARRRELAAVRGRLENRLMRKASDAEMAKEMNLTGEGYHVMVASTQAAKQESIDDVYSDHDPFFADTEASADIKLETAEERLVLARCISELSEREGMILQLYFVEELNLDEIGEIINVGAARVCQIKKSALEKLRTRLSTFDIAPEVC